MPTNKTKIIKDLFNGHHARLNDLQVRLRARSAVLDTVCAALPRKLAERVASAGIEQGRLSIGVTGAVWASRLRYVTEPLRVEVSESLGIAVTSVRIRVVRTPVKPGAG